MNARASDERRDGWDFFVSYTQADREWAEWIAWTLEEDRHKVLIQAWDFVPGSNWIHGVQEAVARAKQTIAVVSPAYLESEFGAAEWQAVWWGDPRGAKRRLLVARVAECSDLGLMSGIVSIDLFDRGEAEAAAALRSMTAPTGRRKPAIAPVFPGERARAIKSKPRFPGPVTSRWKTNWLRRPVTWIVAGSFAAGAALTAPGVLATDDPSHSPAAAPSSYTETVGPSCEPKGTLFFPDGPQGSGGWAWLAGTPASGCGKALIHQVADKEASANWVFTPGHGAECTFEIYIPKSSKITAEAVSYQAWETLPDQHIKQYRISPTDNQVADQVSQRGGKISITFGPTANGKVDLQLYDDSPDNKDGVWEVAGPVTAVCHTGASLS